MSEHKQDVIKRLERVMDYIHENIDGDLSLDTLADVACYSRFHFQRLYTAVTGESLAQTVKRTRHSQAAATLLRTEASIEEVAKKYGFASAESFSHGFRSEMGASPAKFRKLTLAKWSENMHKIAIETHPERRLAAIHHKGSYMEIGKAFDTLRVRIHDYDGVDWHENTWIGIYYDDPNNTPEAELRSAAAVTIKKDAELPEGTEEIVIGAGRCAEAVVKGPYAELDQSWEWFYGKWLAESGETPRDEPPFEIYLNDPSETKPEDLLTKIVLPLK